MVDVEPCGSCGQRHVRIVKAGPGRGYRKGPMGATFEAVACTAHVVYDRDTYVKGQKREKLDEPRPCQQPPMKGQTVCRIHGGKSRNSREAGKRRMSEQRAAKQLTQALKDAYGDDVPDVPPAEAMLRAVSWTYAEVMVLRRKVAELDEDERVWGTTREKSGGEDFGTTQEARPNVWWTMLRESMRDLVKFSAAARAAGCDEARVKIAEQTGLMLADVIRGILGDLALTTEQQALVSEVVPRHLRSIAS